MATRVSLFVVLAALFFARLILADEAPPVSDAGASSIAGVPVKQPRRILQDPQTKIIYYLESDLHHIVAISPEGKILWVCEPKRWHYEQFSQGRPWRIMDFRFEKDGSGKDCISVDVIASGNGGGWIDKITGLYTESDSWL